MAVDPLPNIGASPAPPANTESTSVKQETGEDSYVDGSITCFVGSIDEQKPDLGQHQIRMERFSATRLSRHLIKLIKLGYQ